MQKLTMLSEDDVIKIVKEQLEQATSKNEEEADKSWKHLRHEIHLWIDEHANEKKKRSYATLNTWIYSTIRFTTGVSKVDEMNPKQLEEAYRTWEFLKNNNPYTLNKPKARRQVYFK